VQYDHLVPTNPPRSVTSAAVDDYLKAILALSAGADRRVSSGELAGKLGVRAASVTGMLQKLAAQKPALVHYQKHKGTVLSIAGKRRAWELVRHHRLLELFLHDVLKYTWDEVHEEAERLEHFISERFEDRVAAILNDPEIDPHGHVIPRKHEIGLVPKESPLADWTSGTPVVISSVEDRDSAALRELGRLGMVPGVVLSEVERKPVGAVLVRIEGQPRVIRLSNDLAGAIFVRPQHGSTR
jgi:DtxR family transcriptional regulator, Mn-dependent transcriptional regulator